MIVKYTDLAKRFSYFSNDYTQAFETVLESGQFIGGHFVSNFESEVSNYLGVKYAVGVGSGTDALYLLLKFQNFPAGSEIITVPNSYLATVSTIFLNNLNPVYAEIDPNTLQIDTASVEKLINKKTVAIMAVHLMGSPCDIDQLKSLADKYNLMLFEDFSQSFGAKIGDRYVGSFGEAGACSLHPLKNLPCFGDGGFVCTNDKEMKEWITIARTHGHPHRDECNFWSFNMRLDALQAKISGENLKYLDTVLEKRQLLAAIYRKELKNIEQINLLSYSEKMVHTHHTFVILAEKRDELRNYLKKKNIETVVHYPKLIPELVAHEKIAISEHSKKLNQKILSLPISEEHTKPEIGYVCKTITEFYQEYP